MTTTKEDGKDANFSSSVARHKGGITNESIRSYSSSAPLLQQRATKMSTDLVYGMFVYIM